MIENSVLVVGAGFAGAVHARVLAENGYKVKVIDRRNHIAGNCFDYVDNVGVRVHKYGPHLFHTSNTKVIDWITRFGEWSHYKHRVVARLESGMVVPLPVNIHTVNKVFSVDLQTLEEAGAYLETLCDINSGSENAESYLYSTIGRRLTDLFFSPYTEKMWGIPLRSMSPSVVRRVQVRLGWDDHYFPNDHFQALPTRGYTGLFQSIMRHDNISVDLDRSFSDEDRHNYIHTFNSMAIDEYFQYRLGSLPYRSIRFHHDRISAQQAPSHVTINYTDQSPFTRETWWHNLPDHREQETGQCIRTKEEPCNYVDNSFERYYPIKTADGLNEKLYENYKRAAMNIDNMTFIGRCGTYQYLDMHQVINQSLISAERWVERQKEL
ncbi:UDP-galactopyranose mutase [Methylorubrum rhodesianum]|uniref:UDP-galactopyranose mutase n=1 Tax=Methylorubrum rhodesianum TaxID=29427 RepID=UPI003D08AD03